MAHRIPPELAALIPTDIVRRHLIAPLSLKGCVLEVAATNPPPPALLRDLSFLIGKRIVHVVLESSEIDELIADGYPGVLEVREKRAASANDRFLPTHLTAGTVIQLVDRLLQRAIELQASDIHFEPYESDFRVRYRLDGVLHIAAEPAARQKEEIISRLKIMAGLDIAERRRPQDGRIRIAHAERTVDVRVSTLPTDFGEKVVLRILDKCGLDLDLGALGFQEHRLAVFQQAIRQPFGMILVTGPTGSGKTSTLYAALHALNTPEVNITTIEDPIEYNLTGVNQAHVRSDIGFTFAAALRAFLRQDPNIIMVGEIRDAETAEIAMRAALTGHLVLSTLHTNDAPSTISRLIDMGIEPFLVAASLRLVLAQRLVRRLCPKCRYEVVPDSHLLRELGLPDQSLPFYRGAGCEQCSGTGYRGRTALFELMPVDEAMAASISRHAATESIRGLARDEGMQTLREAALEKLRAGITSPEEVLRETTS